MDKVKEVQVVVLPLYLSEHLEAKYASGLQGLRDRFTTLFLMFKDILDLTLELREKVVIQNPKQSEGAVILDSILYVLNLMLTGEESDSALALANLEQTLAKAKERVEFIYR